MLTKKLANLKYTTHLLLPLTGVSWFSIKPWFIDCWLSRDNEHLILQLSAEVPMLRPRRSGATRIEYLGETHGNHLYRLGIPEEFIEDVHHFLKGRYTKFSERARALINDLSGLPYMVEVVKDGEAVIKVHYILVAIDPNLHEFRVNTAIELSQELYGNDHAMDPAGELLSPPLTREQVYYPS